MSRTLSTESSLVNLKREAKRWLRALRDNDADARERLHRSTPNGTANSSLREVQRALAVEHGFNNWESLLAAVAHIEKSRVAPYGVSVNNAEFQLAVFAQKTTSERDEIVSRFLSNACRDWRTGGGGGELRISIHTASRLLQQNPAITRADIFSAVVGGDIIRVRELLQSDNELASLPGGPHSWPPLLYLASARLLQPNPVEHSVEIARVLLDQGADPNAYYADDDGNHFTVITCVLGRGEQQVAPHARERELISLLMERGAEPYDEQGLYNVFADHASRTHLTNDIVWLLELMHQRALHLGRGADWTDPNWYMLSVGGYRPGAFHLLKAALDARLLLLAEWMLRHGAGPDTRPAKQRLPQYSLFEEAFRLGDDAARELLLRFGANPRCNPSESAYESFVRSTLNGNYEVAAGLFAENAAWRHNPHVLLAATRQDDAEAVRFLLGLGILPDIEENRSRARALHAAAFAGATRAAKVLLEAGADPDFRELNYGATPMSIANWAQKFSMTDLLAPFSRDVFSLVFAGKVERVREILRDSPALALATHANGDSLLMRLPDDEDAAVALTDLLLANGADPSHRDPRGATARDIAERRALLRVVAMLDE